MYQKKVLLTALTLIVFIGLAFARSPLLASLKPSEQARANERIEIPLSSIPENEALEIDWHFHKVFIVKNPAIKAFKIPLFGKNYGLPEDTWEHPFASCSQIIAKNNIIQCSESKEYGDEWLKMAQWKFSGEAIKGSRMPDLLTAPFIVTEKSVVISKEFE